MTSWDPWDEDEDRRARARKIAELQAENEAARAEMEERRQARLASAEPSPTWQVPAVEPSALKNYGEAANAYTEKRIREEKDNLASLVGSEMGLLEKRLLGRVEGAKNEALAQAKSDNHYNTAKLLQMREEREAQQAALRGEVLLMRESMCALREEVATLRELLSGSARSKANGLDRADDRLRSSN